MRISNLFTLFNYLILSASCQTVNTPKKHENNTKVSVSHYLILKTKLKDSVRFYVDNQLKAYYPKENDSLTEIFIDTIVFSPKKDKIAFFAISKNSNDKLASKGVDSEFHYNAYCFICIISATTINSIKWLSVYNISNYDDERETSNDIRKLYFDELNTGDKNDAKFNLNDIRFWDGPLWHKYYE